MYVRALPEISLAPLDSRAFDLTSLLNLSMQEASQTFQSRCIEKTLITARRDLLV